jgi:hypothetical protein
MKHEITAHHLGFGTVTFIVEAEDSAKAFSKWKQVVFNPRQWIVKSNTVVGTATEAA